MNWLVSLYVLVWFVLLTPGVLIWLPPKSSRLIAALLHGLLFAVIFHFTSKPVWNMTSSMGQSMGQSIGPRENFTEGAKGKKKGKRK